MSKRSSRRKRKEQQKKQEARLTADVLAQQGLKAFQQVDYEAAINAWEQAKKKPNPPNTLAAALAEAYFRRAVSSAGPRLTDLQKTVQLQPADPRYRYHLALTYHRQGELAQAEPLYRRLLTEAPPFTRAAVPLTQLLIEQKKPVTKDPVWEQLSPAEQTQLAAAEALLKNKADSTLRRLAEQPLDPLWAGLVGLALKEKATAQQNLAACLEPTLPLLGQGVARYYLGVLAAEEGQTEVAWQQWQAAQAAGLNSRHLRQNLAALAYEQALQAQQAGKPRQAAAFLEQTQLNDIAYGDLRALQQQLNWELGYAAAQKGEWPQALTYWQKAERGGDDSRPLLYNLALAYQHTAHYRQAAEAWRTLLRRRPRKADHPDALSDQQVARIWQNVADNYSKAEDYEEAITTYKNAVKWAPDNINLRLKLVEAYQMEGRWQAAENELNRILEKEPDHIPALTLLAESYSESYYPGQARRIWHRILELEPQNPVARQQLAHSYAQDGGRLSRWGMYDEALKIYQEGLSHVPNSQPLLVMMGGAYADQKKLEQARTYLDQARAINPDDLSTLHTIFIIWLSNDSPQDARQTFEHTQAVTTPVPGAFFLDLAEHCDEYEQAKLGRQILEYTEKRYLEDENIQVGVAMVYINLDEDQRGVPILRRVLQKNPAHIEANIQLGVAYHFMDQSRLAQRHWSTAENLARKNNDHLLLHRIKLMKDELLYGKVPAGNPLEMLFKLPPQVREQLVKTAPPEIAEMLRDMSPEEMEIMLQMAAGFGDEFFDEDDF